MTQMTVLQPVDPFPSLTAALPGGRALGLPDALAGRGAVRQIMERAARPQVSVQMRTSAPGSATMLAVPAGVAQ
jgi:hypothetical protein